MSGEELSALVPSILDKCFMKKQQGGNMSKEQSFEAARITTKGVILGALIGAIATVITGLLAFPPFQEWVRSWGSDRKVQALAIEEIPQRVFAYDGSAENLGGWANYNTIFDGFDGKPYYELAYSIPEDQTSYGGLAFQFETGKNLSAYKVIVFTLQFDDVNNPIEFYAKDISGKGGRVRIVSNSTNNMPLRYEFTNFGDVNFNALKEVGINVDNTFSSGGHVVTIHSIRFEQ
jgi:hypothetical protein